MLPLKGVPRYILRLPGSVGTTSPSMPQTEQHYVRTEVVARPRRARWGRSGLGPEPAEAAGAAEVRGESESELEDV